MAVGDRIKRARNLRGMTQKELGIAIGFEEKSADIRIAQYEHPHSQGRAAPQDCGGTGCELPFPL